MPPAKTLEKLPKHFRGESHHAIKEMVIVAGQKIKKIVTVHMLLIHAICIVINLNTHQPKPIANSQHSSQPGIQPGSQPGSVLMLCACLFVGRYFKTPVPAVCM